MVPFSWSVSPLIGLLFPSDGDTPEQVIQLQDEVETFWKSLISIMWLPLNSIQPPVKEIIYGGQAFVFLITASYQISVNTVFVTFIVQIIGQFEILLETVNGMDDAVNSCDLLLSKETEDFTNTILRDVFGSETIKSAAKRRLERHDDPSELHPYFVDVIRHHQAVIA